MVDMWLFCCVWQSNSQRILYSQITVRWGHLSVWPHLTDSELTGEASAARRPHTVKQLTPHVELFLTASVLESDFLFQLTCYPLFLVMFIMDVIIFYHRTIKKEKKVRVKRHHITSPVWQAVVWGSKLYVISILEVLTPIPHRLTMW